jgi:hypothetical protein
MKQQPKDIITQMFENFGISVVDVTPTSSKQKKSMKSVINKKPSTSKEELWDWCCTEVMRLDNGKDVWNQINKVHQFSKASGREEAINYISQNEGWEETADMYRKHFNLPVKYKL